MMLDVHATDVTDYLKAVYEEQNNVKAKIVSKGESVSKYEQYVGETFVPNIAYGYGYLKIKRCKRQVISYICLLDCDNKPIWGYIIPR